MSNVIFLNHIYRPSDEKMRELAKMQEDIHFTKVHYFFQLRNNSPSMIMARKNELHRMWRSRWQIYIQGESEPKSLENFSKPCY